MLNEYNIVVDTNMFAQREYTEQFSLVLLDLISFMNEMELIVNNPRASKSTIMEWNNALEERAREYGQFIIQAKKYNLWKGLTN